MSKRFGMWEWTGLLSVAVLLVFSSLPTGAATCNYSIIPTQRTHGHGATNNTIGVNTTLGCPWSVVNTNGWIAIVSPTSNTNSGMVSYTVEANPNISSRTGIVVIAGIAFTMRQNGVNCDYSISPEVRLHGHGATNNTLGVMTGGVCPWTAASASPWLTIVSNASGTGEGIVGYSVDANPSFDERTGMVLIENQVFTVVQSGMPCMYSITPATRGNGFGMISNSVSLTATPGCAWTVTPSNSWITTSPQSGTGSSNISYFLKANPTLTERTGTVMIADKVLTLFQDPGESGPCIYDISPPYRMHGPGATNNSVRVQVPAGCYWTAQTTNAWIKIVPGYGGVGTDEFGYTVDTNLSTMWRTGVVTVADRVFTVSQDGTPCTASIVPKNRSHGPGAATNYVRVPVGAECVWTVVNTNIWLSIVPSFSGLGYGDVGYTVQANLSTNARSGVVTVASQNFMVTQAGYTNACSYAIMPSGRNHGYGARNDSIEVTAGPTCAWTVQNTNPWITILSGAAGTGSGTVSYAIAANANADARTGVVMIANQILTLTQRGTTNTIFFETIVTVGNGEVTVSLVGERGTVWELQGSADLFLWEKIASVTNTTGSVEYTDIVPGVADRRFYRAILP